MESTAYPLRSKAIIDEAREWLPDDGIKESNIAPVTSDRLGRIVVAEDNADMREYISRLVRDAG
ncbi:MAG: hypothetical protein HZB29_05960 [Nitrospinae bacterium]|nr:hypothetical protein [Nitrospinota bacterium]